MGVGVDQKNSKRHMVTFSQGGTTLPDRDFYLKDDLRSKNIRDKYVPHVARMFELVGFETAQANKNAQQAKSVRATRGQKLADSDWTQVADAPVDKAVWATYRQALRDITTQSEFPWTITWPDAP